MKISEPEPLTALGTTQYYRHQPGFVLTDGAKWLAESAGCYWLYDIIWSIKPVLANDSFAVVKLIVKDGQGDVSVEDGNDRVLYTQHIEYTDFPLPEIMLYVVDADERTKVIMLPGEY